MVFKNVVKRNLKEKLYYVPCIIEEYYIWYENGKWHHYYITDLSDIGDKDIVYYTSSAFAACPEKVESWSTYTRGNMIFSIEKIKCQNK